MIDEKRPLDLTRIVLAVDDELDAFFIQTELRKLEFPFSLRRVVSKHKLVEALVAADPALLILELSLTGLEILEGLHEQWPELPIIVVSPARDETLPERCRRAGAADFIQISNIALLPESVENHVRRENLLAGRG
jgi:DNA-binding NarL/FixJ family response regulator